MTGAPDTPGQPPRSDDELIAAFLDGRLSEAERAVVFERLANDPELYELLLSTVEILREAEAEATAAFRELAALLNASRDRLTRLLSIMVERAMHGETPTAEELEAARGALADVGYRRTWDRREDTTPLPPEGGSAGADAAHG